MTEPARLRRILRDLDVAYSERTWPDLPGGVTFVVYVDDEVIGLPWDGESRADDHGHLRDGWDGFATLPGLLLETLAARRELGHAKSYALLCRVLNAALRWEDGDAD